MINWSLYQANLNINGETDKERNTNNAKQDFLLNVERNPGYQDSSLRNGVLQKFLIDRTETSYKYKIVAFPDEELNTGDVVNVNGMNLIMMETYPLNEIQNAGIGWLCNINLKFQNNSATIITKPAVLDSGVFSTTKNGNTEVQETDKQFKMYLPYDEDTARIFVDKRIAVDTRYDSNGKQILECYEVTGINRVARSYGTGGHLLVLELRSANYSPSNDSIENMICDYIGDLTPIVTTLPCYINGRNTIPIGTKRKYSIIFYDGSNNVVDNITPIWSISVLPSGITTLASGKDTYIVVENEDDLIGQTVTLSVTDETGAYNASIEVEVVC